MRSKNISAFYSSEAHPLAIVLGTNEIASAVAARLRHADYSVVLSHDPFPPVIRRMMAFHDALYGDPAVIDGIDAERADTTIEIASVAASPRRVAVTPLQLSDLLAIRSPAILVDARMQKHRVTPDYRSIAQIAIGLGPNFLVRENCDIAVETKPIKNGMIVTAGSTDAADGMARPLGGAGRERFVYSDRTGLWHTPVDIGMRVFKGFMLGNLDGMPVHAPIDGLLRGIARDGSQIPAGVKLLEIDPRGRKAVWTGTDERGRAIAGAVMRSIQAFPERPRKLRTRASSAVRETAN